MNKYKFILFYWYLADLRPTFGNYWREKLNSRNVNHCGSINFWPKVHSEFHFEAGCLSSIESLVDSGTFQFDHNTLTHKWRRGVVVITIAQLHSTKPELRFCAGSNPAHVVSEIRDGDDLWQWSWLEIRLNVFHWSTIPQKFIIIIIIIIITVFWQKLFFFSIFLVYCSFNLTFLFFFLL